MRRAPHRPTATIRDRRTARAMASGTDPLETPGLSGDTLVEERVQPSNDDGDHERFAHYVEKHKIVESAVTGKPVRALCGKKWVPGRDPSRYPVCPDCKRIYDGLPPGDNGGPGGGSGGDRP